MPTPGGAEERHELRRALALDAGRDGAQDGELLVAPDERRGQPGDAARMAAGSADRARARPTRARAARLALRLEVLVLADT